jgi:hypothetical protein
MPDNEKCPLFPSIPRLYCSHCQGTARGTRDNPKFSIKTGYFDGFPVVEVLKDGGAIHLWDSHFRFGLRKAEVVINCIDILRDFWRSNGYERKVFVPRVIENRRRRLSVKIYVELHPDFERSDGETIDRPWLHLKALPPDKEHIGLGVLKCRAVCEVEDEIKKWLREHGLPYS